MFNLERCCTEWEQQKKNCYLELSHAILTVSTDSLSLGDCSNTFIVVFGTKQGKRYASSKETC